MMKPFSNGSEFMHWYDNNCCRCTRAMHMDPMPGFDVTQKMVNLGRECRLKFALDVTTGMGDGDIPDEVAAVIGTKNGNGLNASCMMFSDNNDDRWRPPNNRKPTPEDDRQLMLFSIIDEVMEEQREILERELESA